MNILFLITTIFYGIWILRNILFWVSLWQLKEYRFDRMRVHLLDTYQGRHILFSPFLLLKIFVVFSYVFIVFNTELLFFYQTFIICLYLVEGFSVISETYKRVLKRPVFTLKASGIVVVCVLIIGAFSSISLIDKYLWFVITDIISSSIVLFIILTLSFPTELYRDIIIQKASKKIRNHQKLLVIGVTGSYGKSSTKEFIAQILERKFTVLKTQGTNNTPIGVSNTILHFLRKNTEIFVVELGAYKRGEIDQLCQIVKPKIGVLTAVSQQHLALFGSLENIASAKYELIISLPKDGTALFNGNNKSTYTLYKNPPKDVAKVKKQVLYSVLEKDIEAEIFAHNITVDVDSVRFDVKLHDKKISFQAPLLGAFSIENILPGIYIAYLLGMRESEIKKAVSLLSPLPKTMVRHMLLNKVSIIDDTFNSNPQAVVSALSYIKIYKHKKIMVLQPMIELGINARAEHIKIGREIGLTCDYLFLTNKNFFSSIIEGIKASGRTCITQVASPSKISSFITNNTKKGDVVVFEGREAGNSLAKIL